MFYCPTLPQAIQVTFAAHAKALSRIVVQQEFCPTFVPRDYNASSVSRLVSWHWHGDKPPLLKSCGVLEMVCCQYGCKRVALALGVEG